jgi:hypothetical protein
MLKGGQLVDPLLVDHYSKFKDHWNSADFKLTSHQFVPPPLHPDVPLSIIRHVDKSQQEWGLVRVLNAYSRSLRAHHNIEPAYKTLISWMKDQYMAILHGLEIPQANHDTEITSLLSWLDNQIFAPENSVPLVGIIRPPWPLAEENGSLTAVGEVPLEILYYLSGSRKAKTPSDLAAYLLKRYLVTLGGVYAI